MGPNPGHVALKLVTGGDSALPQCDTAPRSHAGASAGRMGGLRLVAARVAPMTAEADAELAMGRSLGGRGAPVTPSPGSAPANHRRPPHPPQSHRATLVPGESTAGGGRASASQSATGRGASREAFTEREARRGVARENLLASALPATDVRWMLALRVQHALEGGRAAMLPPETRRRLVSDAQLLGLRPFDANLVIAIVQDQARQGRDAAGEAFSARLSLVPLGSPTPAARPRVIMAVMIAICFGLAMALAMSLALWVLQR